MQTLSKTCQSCSKPMHGGLYRASHICPHCYFEHAGGKKTKKRTPDQVHTPQPATTIQEPPAQETSIAQETTEQESATFEQTHEAEAKATTTPVSEAEPEQVKTPDTTISEPLHSTPVTKAVNPSIVLTANPSHEQVVLKLFEEVSATCILNIELTPDLFIDGKFAGAKSPKIQAALKQGKKDSLDQLRSTAQSLGANMVADIEVKNGMKMVDKKNANITVSASGTALLAETSDATAVA